MPASPAIEKFDRWLARQPARGARSDAEMREGEALAEKRSAAMRELILTNPGEAMRRALTPGQRARLPESVRQRVEQRIAGHAALEVICETPVDGGHSHEHVQHGVDDDFKRFVVVGGKRYRAHVTGAWRDLPTLESIPIEAVAVGNDLALSEEAPPATETDTQSGGAVAASPYTEGAKTILYIRARFADEAADFEPITESTAAQRQEVVNQFMQKNSYGKTSLATTFTTTVALPQKASAYTTAFSTLLSEAAAAAKAAGLAGGSDWNIDSYNLYVVVTSNKGNFAYAGSAWVGSQGAHLRSDYTTLRTAGHEYGHNLGLWHANYWRTNSPSPIGRDSVPGGYVTDGSGAERLEYGHRFSIMSAQSESDFNNADKPHFSVVEKVKLNWLTAADITTVTASTSTPIRLYRQDHKDARGIRAIKIDRNTDDYSSSTAKRRYWLSYRTAFTTGTHGIFLPSGLQIDWAKSAYGSDGAIQLDMTPYTADATTFYDPAAASSGYWTIDNTDKDDGVLVIGRTYSDAAANIHITPVGKGGTGASQYLDVVVKIGTAGSNKAPATTLTATALAVNIGQAVTFTTSASDPDGDPLAYWWDFGDKSLVTSSLNSPTATKSWSVAGIYPVRATVSDMKGGVASETILVKVGSPSAVGTIAGRVLQGGQPVADARVSISNKIAATTDSDGSYVIAGLAKGSHTVSAAKLNLAFTAQFNNPVSVGGDPVFAKDFLSTQPPAGAPGLTVTVAPYETQTAINGTIQFTATGWTSTGAQTPITPSWSAQGGTISASGLFRAATAGGPFTVSATADGVSGSAYVSVTTTIINDPPAVSLTRPASAAFSIPAGAGLVLRASVSDDGFPTAPGAVTVSWTQVSGPGTAAFENPAAANTTVRFSTAGNYALELAASDGALVTTARFSVSVGGSAGNIGPAVNAGPDRAAARLVPETLTGSASDDGRPAAPGAVTTAWSSLSGPEIAVFGDLSSTGSSVEFPMAGAYVLRLTADDGEIATFDDAQIRVLAHPIEVWREEHFGVNPDPARAGDNADPSGSGIDNLLAYALHLDPLTPDLNRLPSATIADSFLILTYTRSLAAADVVFTPLATTDFITWSGEGLIIEPQPPGPETQEIRVKAPLTGPGTFLRLKVERLLEKP